MPRYIFQPANLHRDTSFKRGDDYFVQHTRMFCDKGLASLFVPFLISQLFLNPSLPVELSRSFLFAGLVADPLANESVTVFSHSIILNRTIFSE